MNAFGMAEKKKNLQLSSQELENPDETCNYTIIISYGVCISILVTIIAIIVTLRLYRSGQTQKIEDNFYLDNFTILTEIKSKIKLHLITYRDRQYQLNLEDETTISEPLEKKFKDLRDDNQLQKICLLGIKVLNAYFQDLPKKNYYKISGNIVLRVLKTVMSYKMNEKINKNNMELFTVDLPHLLTMYELIARINNNLSVDRSATIDELIKQCHKYIDKVIDVNLEPKYNKASAKENSFISISAPYFLTTYLDYDNSGNTLYRKAIIGDNIRRLHKYLLHEQNSDAVVRQYGVLREDGGALLSNKIANYSTYIELIEKIKYPEFYAAVYDSLDLPGNLYKSAQIILDKLLHRGVPYLPFGLFRLDCNILKEKNYWNLGTPKNITLIPSIGVGIYKTEKFMFPLRIQRENIPICPINNPSDNNYAIGAIQLRTMYLTGEKNYEYIDLNDWDQLYYQPSIITVGEKFDCLPLIADATTKLFSPNENGYNYIGQIPEDNLMFWKNDYSLKLIDNNELNVIECGIANQNGISIIYEIRTLSTGTEYQFHFDIVSHSNKGYFDYTIKPIDTRRPLYFDANREHIKFNSSEKVTFKWDMNLKDNPIDVDLTYDSSREEQRFTSGTTEYKVNSIKNYKSNEYYVVQRDDQDYLLGSMSGKKDHTIKHNGHTYKRNEETFMYDKN